MGGKSFAAVAMDLDGTVYNGNKVIPGAPETVDAVRESGREVLFCTNNSTKTAKQISDKLCQMGIKCMPDDVYTSGEAVADYIESRGSPETYVMGSPVLRDTVSEIADVVIVPEEAEALVVGFDPHFDYQSITLGVRAAIHVGIIAFCNEDAVFMGEDGKIYPGPGAMTSAVRACAKIVPDIVVGKPNPYLMRIMEKRSGLRAEDMLVVGDSFDTDIMFAKNCGTEGILVGKKEDGVVCVNNITDIMKQLES